MLIDMLMDYLLVFLNILFIGICIDIYIRVFIKNRKLLKEVWIMLLKILFHLFMIFLTGGFWLLVLLVALIVKYL